ncbi:unnamed protein product [marine sediment metagenome]|uniref:HK97 gp10 family phage protein n=1 Tax=marine sediment metagenome TaxID=412755 RepID=X0SHJ6_9ZZZZ
MFVDMTDFDKHFPEVTEKVIPNLAEKALFQGGFKMIRYAIEEEPRVPHKWGPLWKSQLVKLAARTTDYMTVLVGFTASYAAAQHEAPAGWSYTLEGSGPKFLEAKLPRHMNEIYQFVANYIKKHGK